MYVIEIENGGQTELLHDLNPSGFRKVTACKFEDDLQAVPYANITVNSQNPAYEHLHELKTIIRIINTHTGTVRFEGRILQISDSGMKENGIISKKLNCEGLLGYLCDTVQLYHHYENTEVRVFLCALLDYHNSIMQEESPERCIIMGICEFSGTASKTTAQRTTLDEIRENLISRLGGVLRLRRNEQNQLVLDYLSEENAGRICETKIELARNMKSLSSGTDMKSLITRLYPFGCQVNDETAERLTIASANDGCPYLDNAEAIQKYGIKCGSYVWDDVTLPEHLLSRGQEYLLQCSQVKKSYQATVLDLSAIGKDADDFQAGNTYRFVNKLLHLDEFLKVMKITADIFKPYQPVIEIGDKAEKITDITSQTRKYVEYAIPKQRSEILRQAQANTTALLNNATKGYIFIDNENGELLIMDTPDKSTATKVWRWNSSGFAYSNQGYNEGYFVGMTRDGGIIADRITSGTITGIEFNNGNGTFRVTSTGEVTASAIQITGGKINISTNNENYDAIVLNCNYHNEHLQGKFTPIGLTFTDDTFSVIIQHGGIWGKNNDTTTFYLSSETGNILCGNIQASGDVQISGNITSSGEIYCSDKITGWNEIKSENLLCAIGGGGYYNVGNEISAMKNNIQTLWDAVFPS